MSVSVTRVQRVRQTQKKVTCAANCDNKAIAICVDDDGGSKQSRVSLCNSPASVARHLQQNQMDEKQTQQ